MRGRRRHPGRRGAGRPGHRRPPVAPDQIRTLEGTPVTIFAIHCLDKPASLELRLANREAHLAYAGSFKAHIKLGGPLLNEAGEMAGSMLIMEFDDIAQARAFSADDPYVKAGLFQRVDITAFKPTLGGFAS
nr:YciI family protein [Phenylobacterium haematophilum]